MKPITDIAQDNPSWSLPEFVEVVNAYLPSYLPLESSNAKVRDQVTARLVRHYTTQNMLDEPYKSGREARYTYRHLLQTLVVRRLLADGYASHVIGDLATSKRNDELEALLQGGVQLQVTVANPALAYLHQIQEREAMATGPLPRDRVSQRQVSPAAPRASRWRRLEVIPGLELHVREDFPYPSSAREQQNLLQSVRRALQALAPKGRPSK